MESSESSIAVVRIPSGTRGWRPWDEAVELAFEVNDDPATPSCLFWRGSLWRVVGPSDHWSTWRALPVRDMTDGSAPTNRAQRADFWRFIAQTGPVSPLVHFEVRRSSGGAGSSEPASRTAGSTDCHPTRPRSAGSGSAGWRLVRLGLSMELPEPLVLPHAARSSWRSCGSPREGRGERTTLAP